MAAPGAPEVTHRATDGEAPVMYQVRRSVFDRVLLEDAVDAGASLEEGRAVVSAAGGGRGWRLALAGGEEVVCAGVVGAGGARCPLGRRVRAAARGTPTFPRERLAVAWAREYHVGEAFVEEAFGPGRTVRIDLREGGVTGYAWAFPKREHVNVGFGALVDDLRGVEGLAMCEAYARRLEGRGMLPRDRHGGSWRAAPIPMGGPAGPLSRPGVLGVGDCAGLVSPLSGDGIYYALESARLAAERMDAALEGGDLGAEAMAPYGRQVKGGIVAELKLLSRVSKRVRADPVDALTRAAADPAIPPMVVKLFQGEGELRRAAISLYGRSLLAGLRRSGG